MSNFFSKILKQKKIILLGFLVAIAISIPQTTFASWFNPITWGSTIFDGILNGLAIFFLWYPLLIMVAWEGFMKLFLGIIITYATSGATSYTDSEAVQIGWSVVRELANMMIVLGFVIIGIATALRIREYEAKQLLVKLIIVALLVNFSLLICGIFIDGTNITMNFFFNGGFNREGGAVSKWIPGLASTAMTFTNILSTDPISFTSKIFGIMFFDFLAGFVYFLYMILLLARVIALWMLVILSPLAFVCYVFPFTKNVWQMWWKNFFQWCIIVVPAGLFYYIGQRIISERAGAIDPQLWNLTTVADWKELLSNSLTTIVVPGMFLVIGFFVSLQFSAAGASAIMGFANKYKGKILAGGLGVLSKAGGKVGSKLGSYAESLKGSNSKIGKGAGWALSGMSKSAQAVGNYKETSQKTKSMFGRGLERIGAIKENTTAMNEANIVAENEKRIKFGYNKAKATGDTKTIEKIREDAKAASELRGGSTSAASMRVVADAGDLSEAFKDLKTGITDLNAIHKGLGYAEGLGSIDIRKNAAKKMPMIEEYNEPILLKIQKQNPKWSPEDVKREAVVQATVKMAPEDMDRKFIDSVSSEVLESVGPRLNRKQKEQLGTNISPMREEMNTMTRGSPEFHALTDKVLAVKRASKN